MNLSVTTVAAAALAVTVFALHGASTTRPDAPAAPPGFEVRAIARIPQPRELAVAPNGDVIVGTLGSDVYVIPGAQGEPGLPSVFAHLDDEKAAGIALAAHALYVGTTFGVWEIPYATGDRAARGAPRKIAGVRTQGGGGHSTTSVAVSGDVLYASVGSSCNACDERDPTRATIQAMTLDGDGLRAKAVRVRNAIALAVDPDTRDLWAGVAGQDELAHGHPYEVFDDVGSRTGTVNYGWPVCYENRRPVEPGIDCSGVATSRGIFPAYETPIGAAFYPASARGAHAFPAAWRGGAFVALHGSWHKPLVAPLVAFVPVTRDAPTIPIDWNDPTRQYRPFLWGWQGADGRRIGRPTGVAVGSDGSLFVADDVSGTIYRIRPRADGRVSNVSGGRRTKT